MESKYARIIEVYINSPKKKPHTKILKIIELSIQWNVTLADIIYKP